MIRGSEGALVQKRCLLVVKIRGFYNVNMTENSLQEVTRTEERGYLYYGQFYILRSYIFCVWKRYGE